MTSTQRLYLAPDAPPTWDDHYFILDKPGSSSAVKLLVSDAQAVFTGSYAGGNIASKTNGTAAAGQKVVTVLDTTGFIAGAWVAYTLVSGVVEYNLIASITPTTTLTLTSNIGATGIASNVYIGMIPVDQMAAANAIPHAGTLTLPQAMEYANHGEYNVQAFGASPSASAAVNTAAIQSAIDTAAAAGARYVNVPPGVYSVNDTINLKDNICLRGAITSGIVTSKIVFSPTSSDAHLFSNVDPVTDYIWGVEISSLHLTVGTGVPGDAIHLIKPGFCTISNVWVNGFKRSIWLGGAMGAYVEKCFAKNQTIASIEINESVWSTTTTSIVNTFVGESSPWGVLVRGDAIHVTLDNVVCQSTTVGGIDIYKGSIVTMNDCYAEDVPGDGSAGSIIQVGVNTDGSSDPSILQIHGGQLGGYNLGYHANSVGVYADEAASVSIIGSTFTRVGKILKTTTNTGHVETWGVAHYQTGATPWDAIYNLGKVTGVFHNAFSDNAFTAYLRANKIALTSDGLATGWRIVSEYENSNSDLTLYSYNGSTATKRVQINNTGVLMATGGIGVGNSAAASTLGNVVKNMEVFDAAGASLGFVAIYDAITV